MVSAISRLNWASSLDSFIKTSSRFAAESRRSMCFLLLSISLRKGLSPAFLLIGLGAVCPMITIFSSESV